MTKFILDKSYIDGVKTSISQQETVVSDVASSVSSYSVNSDIDFSHAISTVANNISFLSSKMERVVQYLDNVITEHTSIQKLTFDGNPVLNSDFAEDNSTNYSELFDEYKKVANDVKNGKYGNGEERKRRLQEKGYDPSTIQKLVNNILYDNGNMSEEAFVGLITGSAVVAPIISSANIEVKEPKTLEKLDVSQLFDQLIFDEEKEVLEKEEKTIDAQDINKQLDKKANYNNKIYNDPEYEAFKNEAMKIVYKEIAGSTYYTEEDRNFVVANTMATLFNNVNRKSGDNLYEKITNLTDKNYGVYTDNIKGKNIKLDDLGVSESQKAEIEKAFDLVASGEYTLGKDYVLQATESIVDDFAPNGVSSRIEVKSGGYSNVSFGSDKVTPSNEDIFGNEVTSNFDELYQKANQLMKS